MLLRTLSTSEGPVPVKALAEACGLEAATAWRLLRTLETHGLVEKVEPARGYRLGLGVLGLVGGQVVDSLGTAARPLLERLATQHGVTASLAFVERFSIAYVDQVDSAQFRSPDWRGQAISMHASSPGKAVLAQMSDADRRQVIGEGLPRLTESTITEPRAFEAELARVREVGYAVCEGEDVSYSNGVATTASLHGRVVAVINLWGPERLVPASRFDELGGATVDAARELELILLRRVAD
ncbi:IclR family transcriptional regulator C-terminal domain-containing protein (plasmid) [Curtobacterium sp. MCLR17_007]|uniref:IclR family transcriptional regulator n=1 Tax=Curtobacterium sp. MCLR17_007 TaxID=2175648 RepID=UPI0015E89AAF|nr:IclR family transcriptional regulator C-terminal domain-containing protein [Curtobacterium sp. MCLR17_007]WIB62096.1 IclR family transcriptional regulator C-terminal domain-containing protein [Curtobacterium sp. MCLR17_007]